MKIRGQLRIRQTRNGRIIRNEICENMFTIAGLSYLHSVAYQLDASYSPLYVGLIDQSAFDALWWGSSADLHSKYWHELPLSASRPLWDANDTPMNPPTLFAVGNEDNLASWTVSIDFADDYIIGAFLAPSSTTYDEPATPNITGTEAGIDNSAGGDPYTMALFEGGALDLAQDDVIEVEYTISADDSRF